MKDLSISIVAFNDEEDVLTAVSSIEEHTPSLIAKTIYIIDNSDKPNNLSSSLAKFDDCVYMKQDKNLGFGAGHNRVLDIIDSRYHAIVNPDIILREDAFSPLISYLDNNDAGMVAPRILDENGDLIKAYRLDPTPFDMFIRMFLKGMFKKRKAHHTMQDMDYSRPFKVPFVQGSFLVIRTDLFRKLHGFDERFFLYMEDADLCRRVNSVSTLYYCPDASVIHLWGQGSHKSIRLFRLHVSSMIRYFKKWK
ncbi:MAG: glycosyltransferase family 2 protein [Lachnospiraceae bacterium]|nr:glycosyltransferase family 2 protein [Lachnospiraceae bacterium]